MSAWVNEALRDKASKDRHQAAFAAAVSAYESEHGVIGPEELAEQARRDRGNAAAVRAWVKRRNGAA